MPRYGWTAYGFSAKRPGSIARFYDFLLFDPGFGSQRVVTAFNIKGPKCHAGTFQRGISASGAVQVVTQVISPIATSVRIRTLVAGSEHNPIQPLSNLFDFFSVLPFPERHAACFSVCRWISHAQT